MQRPRRRVTLLCCVRDCLTLAIRGLVEGVGGGQAGGSQSASEWEVRFSSPHVLLLTWVTPGGKWHPQQQTPPMA